MPGIRAYHKPGVAPQFSDEALLDDLRRVWGLCGTERHRKRPAGDLVQ